MRVPIRVLPICEAGLVDAAVLCNDTTEELTPANPFLEIRQKETPFDIALQTLQNITARRNPNFYMISNTWGKVARFCLFKPAYKLGEDIIGTFDFTVATVSCMQVSVSLQCEEETSIDQSNDRNKQVKTTTFSKHHEVCLGYKFTQMILPIPLHVTPTFSTQLVSLKWKLHFDAIGGTLALYAVYKIQHPQKDGDGKIVKLTSRERRFIRFASVEYDGQLYMTPQDFLESVVEAEPRPRLKRRLLTAKDVDVIKDSTPPLSQGSPRLFRNLRDKGIISYTEYLFLLSILTKPQSGFRIAFNMFDTDGNERVDKNEFLVMEKIFSHAWKGKRGMATEAEADVLKLPIEEQFVDDERGLQRRHAVDTTLIVHFFGPKGKDELNFEGFRKFMLHLQTEVLELEFSEFAKGLPTISEVDFAKILLRYTYLDTDEYDMYLDRLLDRIKDSKGITFEEFYVFCQFLNNLEDFSIAMRMYTLADHPISKDEFHRAVKICTGTSLSPHIVHTVFAIFDDDGDGLLSYREFIAIMKDRLHRGFKSYAKNEGWDAFKLCIKQEMKTPC